LVWKSSRKGIYPGGGAGVNLLVEDLQGGTLAVKDLNDVGKVFHVPGKAVQLPDHQLVTGPDHVKKGIQDESVLCRGARLLFLLEHCFRVSCLQCHYL
jgi:hypothetical protein